MNKKVMSAVLAAATVAGLAAGCMTASAEDDKLVVYGIYKAGDQTWFIDEGAAAQEAVEAAGGEILDGFQLRYIYFIDKRCKEKLTVPIIPFSKIDELGAGMYKGEKITQQERHNKKQPE